MPPRLARWDYAANGAYFLTICTAQRAGAFGQVGPEAVHLSALGSLLSETLLELTCGRPGIGLDAWVVMPDHVHFILFYDGQPSTRTPVETFVAAVKASVTSGARRVGILAPHRPLWQRGFYDRVIRNDRELQQLRDYIATNPRRWLQSGR